MLKKVVICNDEKQAKELYMDKGKQEGVLFLSEKLELVRKFRNKACWAPILTEENKDLDFSDLPFAVSETEELEERDFERLYRRLAGLPWEILETSRCRIRETAPEDVGAFYKIYRELGDREFASLLFEDPRKERDYIKNYRKYIYEFYGYGIWTVLDKSTGEIIGRAGLEPRDGEVELGYVLAKKRQRQGIAYEICRAILDYAEEEIRCDRIISRVRKENLASRRLLEKLGFEKEGGEDKDGYERYRWLTAE